MDMSGYVGMGMDTYCIWGVCRSTHDCAWCTSEVVRVYALYVCGAYVCGWIRRILLVYISDMYGHACICQCT